MFKKKLSKKTRKPKIEIPETFRVGWWSNQEKLIIEGFSVEIIQSELNLFNNKSLISYTINGKIKPDGDWVSYVKEIHISERLNKNTTPNCDRIIELTPIVAVKKGKKMNGAVEKFKFTNEYIITSGHWGVNRIKLVCGTKEQTIELKQTK
ncbi:hypothetical protein OOZ15_09370 [Galbibacter sp. EGI 63066]|uniref:hypothetical protein n=1 Tax=Galbibacter sp. EGI 63066 TaxID=2993559 RepID=UPI002248E66F|nr:hypothetical protein [Galbibacter sp. EGI 63066]MCX2680147.1 hypothetical protein [Galbibacter sp. EGI 63066]